MYRYLGLAVGLGLILATLTFAQEEKAPEGSGVLVLLEDDSDFLIQNLTNQGNADASVAERREDTFYSGSSCLAVTSFQRFNSRIPGWRYKIAANPQLGEYRYLRFAWKRTEGAGIMLQLHAAPGTWHRYSAGTLSKNTQSWGDMTRIAEEPPRQWQQVTRDLIEDFGPMTITGISFSALEGPGEAFFDHIYLGRTVEELDRVTATKKGVVEAATAQDDNRWWWLRIVAMGLIFVALVVSVLAWVLARFRARSQPVQNETAPEVPPPNVTTISISCSGCGKQIKARGATPGQRARCPGCGQTLIVPESMQG